MSFSDAGGTIALQSPTHVHHMDVTAAVRNLRRSISRSPSKLLQRTGSHNSDGSLQGSPQSPRQLGSSPLHHHNHHHHRQLLSGTPERPTAANPLDSTTPQGSPAHTPLRPSGKLSLRSSKFSKTSTPSRITRARASPKSPLKRALSATPDSGNSAAAQSTTPLLSPGARPAGQENSTLLPRPLSRPSTVNAMTGAQQLVLKKALNAVSETPGLSAASALKRSDATMNLDQPHHGSPMPKRRSLHGIAIGDESDDVNIFGTNTTLSQSFDIHEDLFADCDMMGDNGGALQRDSLFSPTTASSALHKRSSSLRKSTLQQRYGEKTSWGRRSGERQLSQLGAEFSTPVRGRPRLCKEQFVPPESPFASLLQSAPSHATDTKSHQPHPLSKTLTTSTSGNSLTEQPSLYAPAKLPKPHPFSRSVPPNAPRPLAHPQTEHPKVVATPNHSHRLFSGAFTSTGLISKVNRNPEEEADKRMAPPDTPCKKQTNPFATFPPTAGSAIKKRPLARNSFAGLPSTPFKPLSDRAPDTFGNPGKGLAIFQRGNASQGGRRASLLSMDGEDRKLFAESFEFPSALDGDAPPTPTKNALTSSTDSLSEQSLESPSMNRTFALPLSAVKPGPSRESSCKSHLESPSNRKDQGEEASPNASRPSPLDCGPSSNESLSFSSFGRSRSHRGFNAPSPLSTQSTLDTGSTVLPLKFTQKIYTKITCVDSASPADGRRTPQTPQESLLPLDTSRLSISQAGDGLGDNCMPPPVTPTTARDFRSSTGVFVTPVNARTSNVDIDACLYSKFDRVDQIGKGEFSTVYKVTKSDPQTAFSMNAMTPSNGQMRSPARGLVYAVKKIKQPYNGPKARDMMLKEARILQALSHSEHVVQFIDYWEHDFHVYIQTEFCEEGTLERFLGNIGRLGRLDDFRIYKIVQDLCLGLKEIHDAGFMHLDMKPANILITFEGALKIGDFGLAQPVSRDEHVDLEGDREYMAPEMLGNKALVGQSADVFSLGLMILEAAANVVLPDNGPTWQALRSGDLSEVPSLTWNPSVEVERDSMGNPTESARSDELQNERPRSPGNLFGSLKRSEVQQPPDFMVEAFHPSSLDSIVRWMTSNRPEDRPLVGEVLALEGLRWVAEHRNAPATVYEGNWGPLDLFPVSIASDVDTEMTDV